MAIVPRNEYSRAYNAEMDKLIKLGYKPQGTVITTSRLQNPAGQPIEEKLHFLSAFNRPDVVVRTLRDNGDELLQVFKLKVQIVTDDEQEKL